MPRDHDQGSVTAEYAVALPAAALVLVGALTAGAGLWQQIRLEEAAASAARQIARGDDTTSATSTVQRIAGSGATLTTQRDQGWVTVSVLHAPPGPLDWWGDWTLEATAHAPDQWVTAPRTTP